MFLRLASFPGDKALVRMGCKKPRLGLNVATPQGDFLLQFCQIGLVSFPFWNRSHAKAEITRAFPIDFSPWIKTLS
jgi:hypothetical protein